MYALQCVTNGSRGREKKGMTRHQLIVHVEPPSVTLEGNMILHTRRSSNGCQFFLCFISSALYLSSLCLLSLDICRYLLAHFTHSNGNDGGNNTDYKPHKKTTTHKFNLHTVPKRRVIKSQKAQKSETTKQNKTQ